MACVIFDLDGTLADTSGDLVAAANACFDAMGLDRAHWLDPQADAAHAVRGGRRMLTVGLQRAGRFSEALVDEWYQPLLEAYAGALDVHTVLYPGAVDAVEVLRCEGHSVGICTNKPAAMAEQVMQSLGCRDLFGSLIGADTLPVRKPDVAPFWAAVDGCGGTRDAACLVGDSDTDRNTARNAGVASILVTFSPEGRAVLDLAPEASIDHFDELPGVVRGLFA